MSRPTFEEVSTFLIAIIILSFSFYGLLREGTASSDARVIYGGLIGSVATFFFARSATKEATKHTIDAQNNGLQEVRKTVGRIEDNRQPTLDERKTRDAHI